MPGPKVSQLAVCIVKCSSSSLHLLVVSMFGIYGSNYSDLAGGAHPHAYTQVLNVFAQATCVYCKQVWRWPGYSVLQRKSLMGKSSMSRTR